MERMAAKAEAQLPTLQQCDQLWHSEGKKDTARREAGGPWFGSCRPYMICIYIYMIYDMQMPSCFLNNVNSEKLQVFLIFLPKIDVTHPSCSSQEGPSGWVTEADEGTFWMKFVSPAEVEFVRKDYVSFFLLSRIAT